jgi:hypothetical protein
MNSTHYSKCKEILNVYLSSPGIYLYKGTKFGGWQTIYPFAHDKMAPIFNSKFNYFVFYF